MVEIWQYMQQFSGIKLLMGDLNAEPHSNAIRYYNFKCCAFMNNLPAKNDRFLQGEVSLGGLWTSELYDIWTVPFSNKALPGLTFSALEEKPAKRVGVIQSYKGRSFIW